MPDFYKDNRDFPNFATGLASAGFIPSEVEALLGGNWHRFFAEGFEPK